MKKILIISDQTEYFQGICGRLREEGFSCSVAAIDDFSGTSVTSESPDILLIGHQSYYSISELSRSVKELKDLPVLAVVETNVLGRINGYFNYVDDFIIKPFQIGELELRVKRLLKNNDSSENNELLVCNDLKIDMAKCEVSVAERVVPLTFKEYELLKFLINNQDRVFTRDALLDKVWGIDYYGGDRTVDVHIRRLRSKLEDSQHSFIETVRNIGYRFRCSK